MLSLGNPEEDNPTFNIVNDFERVVELISLSDRVYSSYLQSIFKEMTKLTLDLKVSLLFCFYFPCYSHIILIVQTMSFRAPR